MSGKANAKQSVSYKPFIQRFSLPPILGIADRVTIAIVPIQNAPLILTGVKMRDISNPAEKEKSRRRDPPSMLSPVSEYPTQISPYGPHMENAARPEPAVMTRTVRALVFSLRIKRA